MKKNPPLHLQKKVKKVPKYNPKVSLDRLWSKLIKDIYQGRCALCEKEGTQAHHFFHKGMNGNVRWDVHNGLWLCFGCHIRRVHQGGDTEPARDALISRIGKHKFYELKEASNVIFRGRKADYERIREDLESLDNPEMIEALRNEGE